MIRLVFVVALVLVVGIGILSNLFDGPAAFLFAVLWIGLCGCSVLDERAIHRRSGDMSGALGLRWLWVFPSTLLAGTAVAHLIGQANLSLR